MILSRKHIVLGVTGSIAAYKAVNLASLLTLFDATVDTVMSPNATQFVGPLSFAGITGRPTYTSVLQLTPNDKIAHVTLGAIADAMVIAPATADTIARLAAGMACDIITATALSSAAPIIIAPAMESRMYLNSINQDNMKRLESRGITIVPPETGRLASGQEGPGRMAEPDQIVDALRGVLGKDGPLSGRKIVVTGGGTRSQIDPVRFIGNPSSGHQGIAIAAAARDRGACVRLILGHHTHPAPTGMKLIHALDYTSMRRAVLRETNGCDALIMAAAINDFETASPTAEKIKRGCSSPKLKLVQNPDFLLELEDNYVKVGFAAETNDIIANAESKLATKRLDAVVANDVTEDGAGFGTVTNHVRILKKGAGWEDVPLASKETVAECILDVVQQLIKGQNN